MHARYVQLPRDNHLLARHQVLPPGARFPDVDETCHSGTGCRNRPRVSPGWRNYPESRLRGVRGHHYPIRHPTPAHAGLPNPRQDDAEPLQSVPLFPSSVAHSSTNAPSKIPKTGNTPFCPCFFPGWCGSRSSAPGVFPGWHRPMPGKGSFHVCEWYVYPACGCDNVWYPPGCHRLPCAAEAGAVAPYRLRCQFLTDQSFICSPYSA